jgi:glucuronoarabinoxylan endo-1,4-beta-xylanase
VATEELPTEVMLSQNYPNPFNPSTTIRFALPVPTEVRLDVFDLLGRQIVTLVNGAMPAGNHQVILNGANLSSGVYVYRIQAGGVVISRKLTLLK